MSAGATALTYPALVDALRRHGVLLPERPDPRGHDVQCPACAPHNPADLSLRIQSRQRNAELQCRNGCDQLHILRVIGIRGVQWVEPPPRRSGHEEHSGQVRIAYRLEKAYTGRLIYVHGIGWFYWDGMRFRVDNAGYAQRAVLDVLRQALAESLVDQHLRKDVAKCESNNGVAGVLGIAAALEGFACTVDQLDSDPYLLNVVNGTLDLRTMELRAHDPADRITKVTLGAYDPDASAPEWASFIDTVLPDRPVRDYLQRVTGMSLQGSVVEHILPVLIGSGGNGKGVWYGAILKVLGDYAAPAVPDLFEAREGAHPVGQMDLLGRRLVVVSELDEGRRLAEATTKRLTGGDVIKARYMHKNPVEFEPSHTAFLVSNFLPKVSGDDPAIWRRIRVIPFDVTIPPAQRDGHLGERLLLEADGILTWIVDGWQAYRSLGGLCEPASVRAATAGYQKDSDAVARFIDDEEVICRAPALKSTTEQLFKVWEEWRFREGAEQISQKKFGQALDAKGFPAGRPSNGKRWRDGIAAAITGT